MPIRYNMGSNGRWYSYATVTGDDTIIKPQCTNISAFTYFVFTTNLIASKDSTARISGIILLAIAICCVGAACYKVKNEKNSTNTPPPSYGTLTQGSTV